MHFEKHLVRVGNSLGVVLDKQLLRTMGLGRKTKVRLRTDGHVIVLERAQKPKFDPGRATREAHAVRHACALDTARELFDSLSPDHMAQLGAGRMTFSMYTTVLASRATFDARWLMVIDRLDRVREAFDANRSTEEAIEEAIAAVPTLDSVESAGRLTSDVQINRPGTALRCDERAVDRAGGPTRTS
jgi:antitoxin component of MazEF toxin-antitoxin module